MGMEMGDGNEEDDGVASVSSNLSSILTCHAAKYRHAHIEALAWNIAWGMVMVMGDGGVE